MGEKPIKREGTKPEKLKCNRRDRPRIHPMKIWQTFRQGLGCNLLKKHKGIPAKSQKKEERTPPFQTGLSKPRNGLPPLDTTIHPPFLIGEPGSLHIPEKDWWKTDLGGYLPTKRNGPACVRASERLVGGGSDHRAPPFNIAAMPLFLPYPSLLSCRSARSLSEISDRHEGVLV